jgi:hypothetical protein
MIIPFKRFEKKKLEKLDKAFARVKSCFAEYKYEI